jgi:hypothetical protein
MMQFSVGFEGIERSFKNIQYRQILENTLLVLSVSLKGFE